MRSFRAIYTQVSYAGGGEHHTLSKLSNEPSVRESLVAGGEFVCCSSSSSVKAPLSLHLQDNHLHHAEINNATNIKLNSSNKFNPFITCVN